MVRSVSFPEKLYQRLVSLAEKMGITVAALIKLACSDYLGREEQK